METSVDGQREKLAAFLEKRFVSEMKLDASGNTTLDSGIAEDGEIWSTVVKAVTADERKPDPGSFWSTATIRRFWQATAIRLDARDDLWRPYLSKLTADFRDLLDDERNRGLDAMPRRTEQMWFLLRFGLIRIILGQEQQSEAFGAIKAAYELDLRLKFDDRKDLHIIDLALLAQRGATDSLTALEDPLVTLEKYNLEHPLADDPLQQVQFENFDLGGDDPRGKILSYLSSYDI